LSASTAAGTGRNSMISCRRSHRPKDPFPYRAGNNIPANNLTPVEVFSCLRALGGAAYGPALIEPTETNLQDAVEVTR
jgi:hypothetical protein